MAAGTQSGNSQLGLPEASFAIYECDYSSVWHPVVLSPGQTCLSVCMRKMLQQLTKDSKVSLGVKSMFNKQYIDEVLKYMN